MFTFCEVLNKLRILFNPIFFYQHLTMHHPHRHVEDLHHPQASTMPCSIAYFAQSAAITPESWNTSDAITTFFEKEGHKDYFINTIVSYVHSLYDILHLWRIGVVSADITDASSISVERLYPLSPHQTAIFTDIRIGVVSADITDASSISVERLYPLSPHQTAIFTDIRIGVVSADITDASSISVERLYPLSPHQTAIFTDITAALSTRQSILDHHQSPTQNTATWEKFRVLLGKPGTGRRRLTKRAYGGGQFRAAGTRTGKSML